MEHRRCTRFGHQVAALESHATVVTCDPRGAGASERPKRGYDFPFHAADALAVLDATRIEQAALVTASRGVNAAVLLVRHRMANPLQTIVGAAATLKARPDLPSDQQLALLDVIVKEAVVLERICLTPKIMHPSESTLAPTPTLVERVPRAKDKTSS